MADCADEEAPEAAGLDPVLVADQVEEAVLRALVPRLVPELGELLEYRVKVLLVPLQGVAGDSLGIKRIYCWCLNSKYFSANIDSAVLPESRVC